MPLTNAEIKSLKPTQTEYKKFDQHGLYILVKPNGAKLWRYKYRIANKESTFSIGPYPEVSLAEARERHAKARKLVGEGTHPLHQQALEKLEMANSSLDTFKAVAEDWYKSRTKSWSGTYAAQVKKVLKADVFPKIGSIPIRQVKSAHILQIVKSTEARGAETVAILIRQWCSQIFAYAIAHLRADYDVSAPLKGAISKPKVEHHSPISLQDIPLLLDKLNSYSGRRSTKIAIELLMLTFVRTGELRKAKWGEFNLDEGLWRVPAANTKMKQEHLVPLSKKAVSLLKELRELQGSNGLLFPNQRTAGIPITGTTINRVLEKLGYGGKYSGHSFRSTASTVLYELDYRTEVIERQLAHAERNSVKAAYNQAEYLKDRFEMMQRYSDYIDSLVIANKK